MIRQVLNAFWDEGFWLPPNTTWEDITPGPNKEVTYTDHRHLLMTIPMALVFLLLRFVADRFLFTPLGKSLGVKEKITKKAPPNAKLEAAYLANKFSKKIEICALAKQSDMSEQQVARWWRRRRAQDKPSTLTKFCESAWQGSFFLYNLIFGVFVLWDKDWLWDVDQCFVGYPHQGLTNDVWWYYIVSFVYYWSELFSLFWCVRRKDFWQLIVHHIITLTMMSLSWVCNFYRIGTLVYLSHDGSEALLQATKAAKYAGYHRFCDCMFLVFTVFWMVTRLGIYPFYIIWGAQVRVPKFPVIVTLVSLLYVLLALNVYWTWLILQIAYKSIRAGQVERDIRSSDSDTGSDDGDGAPQRVNDNKQ